MSRRAEDAMTGIICSEPITKLPPTIEPACALRAQWLCRRCMRLLAGDTLIVQAEGRRTPLAQLATTASPMLTMDALACPRCGGADKIAMTGEH
jgi:hypothetical protein